MERSLKEAAGELKARLALNRERRFPIMGLKGAADALMLREAAFAIERPILVVTPLSSQAEALSGELSYFLSESTTVDLARARVHALPAWELRPFAQLSPQPDVQSAQLAALFALLRQPAPVVVASLEALMMRTIPRSSFEQSVIRVGLAETLDLKALVESLSAMGYQRVPQTEEAGDFSVRGGIIDVFSPLHHNPIRFELEDELVTSIRNFDPSSQRSMEEIEEATIIRTRYIPAAALRDKQIVDQVALRCAEIGMVRKETGELIETLENGLLFPGAELMLPYLFESRLGTILDYLPENAIAWLLDPGRILAEAERMTERIEAEAAAAQNKPSFYPPVESLYLRVSELEERLGSITAVEAGSIVTVAVPREGWAPPIEIKSQASLKLGSIELIGARTAPTFEPLAKELKEIKRGHGRALMVVEGANQAARLRRHLEAYDLEINQECKSFAAMMESTDYRPVIMEGEIAAGVVLQRDGLYVYSEEDLFGEPRARRRVRRPAKGAFLHLEELRPDDLVVHIEHGIGRYRGLKHMKVADLEGDFLNLEYAGNDTMYVPVERINLVQRYVGAEGIEAKLDRLGGGSWDRVKKRTHEAVLAMASDLIEIYAAREATEGHCFPHPGRDYDEFADKFEFEETPDQQAAIDEVVRDMARGKPMDRLICGDAGFGKTEVALRAAFICAMDGRQVAVLTPTTVLAEQHWNNFRNRFKDYPIRIEMVSRFRSPRENRKVIDDLRKGLVDIVIGTHRLLQADVEFPKLGLLIVDEEHRFGVADKERIKRMRKLVEVLTLTATPIPRTLHMAMLGIRDLSVIQTPPPDRQAIRTFVAHFDDGLIRDVILRELNRGGQVFFVHNRIENIEYIARHLRGLLPEAKIAIAHGQMKEHALEEVMRDFIEDRINVLVCTAIIESGLDIPNANTMIINRADHFGLAQLYQLRGRVGRSKRRAYAYLLIPGEHIITREAKRRIDALRELVEAESGTGFKLSMRDLEHRGAGNLLGKEQSGEISAVGFELYAEMMEQAIHELRGEPIRPDFEPELRLGIPAYIPDSFVPDENERLVLYRRLARASSPQDLAELKDELRDRFGPVPTLLENLAAAMNLRRMMREMLVLSAILKADQLEIKFHPEAPVDTEKLIALANANRKAMRLTPAYQVIVQITASEEYERTFAQIESILQALAGCEKLDSQIDYCGSTASQLAMRNSYLVRSPYPLGSVSRWLALSSGLIGLLALAAVGCSSSGLHLPASMTSIWSGKKPAHKTASTQRVLPNDETAPKPELTPAGDVVDSVIASVDGEPITSLDVRNFNPGQPGSAAEAGVEDTSAVPQDPEAKLKALITQQLIQDESKKYADKVDDGDVDRYIQQIEGRNHITDDQLRAQLQQQGVSYADFRSKIRKQAQAMEMFQHEVKDKVTVSDADIEAYYKEHQDDYTIADEKYQLAQILIAVPESAPADEVDAAKKKAEGIRRQAAKGADFSQLARQYSDDDSKSKGGELGEFSPSELNDSIAAGIKGVKPGDVSDLIRTKYGFHIVKVEEHQVPGVTPLADVKTAIREKLQTERSQNSMQKWIDQDLVKEHYVETVQ